ncbi:MAG: response regulator [Verrucomicrobiae bacterium]|nr:response regulator [Verrucomicrobiae bacterium]
MPFPGPLLLVDDDAPFRTRLAQALQSRGANVRSFADAASALDAASQEQPGAALVDLRLDGCSGREGLELLRNLLVLNPALPVVVLTGFASIATAMEAVRLGARDYLAKPVDPDQVLAALEGRRLPPESNPDAFRETPSLDRVEWEHIQRVLADCRGNISRTAQVLGLDRRTLQRKLAKYPPLR